MHIYKKQLSIKGCMCTSNLLDQHVYSPGARADDPPMDKIWTVTKKKFNNLIIPCKIQPLVFNRFSGNDFSIFSPYKCMGM